MHWFLILFLSFFVLHQFIEFFLTGLNIGRIRQNQKLPDVLNNQFSAKHLGQVRAYQLEKERFSLLTRAIKVVLLLAALFVGFFADAENFLDAHFDWSPTGFAVLYLMTFFVIGFVLELPIKYYAQFVIEEKYGFNKMSLGLFVFDQIKTLLLIFLFGLPILFVIFTFYYLVGDFWWLYAFVAFFLFQLFIAAIYPVFLAPLFNKFTPLEEGSLKEQIEALAKKIGFKMSGIFTIDGSKRSGHSNAYFAGMGKMRRIVLFDTLIQQLSQKELLAVLAHEMGHNVKKHVQKNLIFGFFLTLIGFFALGWVIQWPAFYEAFYAGKPAVYKGLLLFVLFLGTFTFWITPITNFLSRKHEFEADAFAAEMTQDSTALSTALISLSRENLSHLQPHPWYSFYYHSHPTLIERIEAMDRLAKNFSSTQ